LTDIDKILLGTEWIKTAAKHHGQKARIDQLGPRGPRLRFLGTPVHARHGSHTREQQQYIRIDWWELGNNWKPDDTRSAHQYDLWKTAVELETLAKEKERLNSMMESDNTIMADIIAPVSTPVEVVCTSVYHKPLKGLVLETDAYKTRQDHWVCLACKAKREEYQKNQAARMRAAKVAKQTPPKKLVIEPVVIESEEVLPEWRVTIVQPTILTLRARDLLDIAVQVEGKGRIVKVELI